MMNRFDKLCFWGIFLEYLMNFTVSAISSWYFVLNESIQSSLIYLKRRNKWAMCCKIKLQIVLLERWGRKNIVGSWNFFGHCDGNFESL
jgi:hypothetical protein